MKTTELHKPKAVVFDMDGVLLDSERLVIEGWEEVGRKHGLEDVLELVKRTTGSNPQARKAEFVKKYGTSITFEKIQHELGKSFQSKLVDGKVPTMPGVNDILQLLENLEIPMGVASSSPRRYVVPELEDNGLLQYFDKVITGDMIEKSKPEPDIYLEACLQLGVDPSAAMAIEDSYNGIRSAHAAGMRPIMIPDQMEATEEMHELSEAVLPSLLDLASYIDKLH